MLKKGHSFCFILNFCFIFVILFLLTSIVFAEITDPAYELAITKAVSKMENADYEGAVKDLEEVLKTRAGDEQATLYLGIALSRMGKRDAEGILKKALSINRGNPLTNLELGIYYFNKSMHDEAKDYLENTIELAPNTEFSAKAEEYLRLLKKGGVPKRWALDILIGGQYDSNVVLNSDDNPLPEGVSRKSDWRAVLYLKGGYNFIKGEKAEGSVSYSLYQSLHSKLTDFNITDHLLELKGTYAISSVINLKGTYSFEHVSVGGDTYDFAHSITPSLIISEGKGFSTVVEYRYRRSHFVDSELFEGNSDRTGSNNLIGVTQHIPIGTSVIFKVGYSHDVDSTREDFWDYRGDKGIAGLQFNLPSNIYIALNGEYYNKDYKGKNPIEGKERLDKVSTASISVTKLLSNNYGITIGEIYTRNKSNIEAYDYKRAITSLFFSARF
ncbi:MAG: hypothetical protein AB1480_09815 [Nitrospirota bacterium]